MQKWAVWAGRSDDEMRFVAVIERDSLWEAEIAAQMLCDEEDSDA